jgi:hypothetical protein
MDVNTERMIKSICSRKNRRSQIINDDDYLLFDALITLWIEDYCSSVHVLFMAKSEYRLLF